MSWIRRLLNRRDKPPPLYRHPPERLSPGWHAHNGGWPLGHTPDDLTADQIIDLFTTIRGTGELTVMTPLARLLERSTPDHLPTPPPTDDQPDCICKPFGAVGQNPECAEHPWWRNDTAVLDLADLTRELRSPWEAARRQFGGSA